MNALLFMMMAVPFFEGEWKSTQGKTTFYAEDQTVKYQNCDIAFSAKAQEIRDLSLLCKHDSYWDFHQVLRPLRFSVEPTGVVRRDSGEIIGMSHPHHLNIEYEEDGQKFFIDVMPSGSGVHVEWSSRSFDDVNFDMKSELQRAL